MTMPIERTDEIAAYGKAVREALADVPEAERAELLEDLEDHLAEVAAESGESAGNGEAGEPLSARLGTPEEYAAELRAAYGAGSDRPRRSPVAAGREAFDTVEAWLRDKAENPGMYGALWSFVIEFRQVWWLARAWIAAMLAWRWMSYGWHGLPSNDGELTVLGVLVVGSVVFGMWTRDRGGRGERLVAVALNCFAVLCLILLWSHSGELLLMPE